MHTIRDTQLVRLEVLTAVINFTDVSEERTAPIFRVDDMLRKLLAGNKQRAEVDSVCFLLLGFLFDREDGGSMVL
jgi:hypothetical protein